MLTSESVSWSPSGPFPGRAANLSASQTAEDKGLHLSSGPCFPQPTSSHPGHSAPLPGYLMAVGGPPGPRIASVPVYSATQTTWSTTGVLRLGRSPDPSWGHLRWAQAWTPSKEGNCRWVEGEANLAVREQEDSLRYYETPHDTDGETEA